MQTPTYATAQAPQQQGAPSPQQAFAQRLIGIAKSLEQAIPGYQMLYSLVFDILDHPAGRQLAGGDAVIARLQEAALYHNAALGAIRRYLCGDTSHVVLRNLAVNTHRLARVQQQLHPLFEPWTAACGAELSPAVASLGQTLAHCDTLLQQAGTAIQASVGEDVWASAHAAVHSSAAK